MMQLWSKPSLNVFLTTIGRKKLPIMLDSLWPQLLPTDYLTVVSDMEHEYVRSALTQFKFACPVIHIANPEPLGFWGHGSRTKYQNSLPGDYFLHGDDDDYYLPGAFYKIRRSICFQRLYLFRIQDKQDIIWRRRGPVQSHQIGTPCGAVPNTGNLPAWGNFYAGDGHFYEQAAKLFQVEWVDFVIYKTWRE